MRQPLTRSLVPKFLWGSVIVLDHGSSSQYFKFGDSLAFSTKLPNKCISYQNGILARAYMRPFITGRFLPITTACIACSIDDPGHNIKVLGRKGNQENVSMLLLEFLCLDGLQDKFTAYTCICRRCPTWLQNARKLQTQLLQFFTQSSSTAPPHPLRRQLFASPPATPSTSWADHSYSAS